MTSKYFLPAVAPLRESVHLGSLVPKKHQPDQDAFSSLEVVEGQDFFVYVQENLGRVLEVAKNASLKTNVSRILSAAFKRVETDTQWLAPCKVRRYQLKDPKKFFSKLITLETTRDWLQSEIEYGTKAVYFIVGYYTAFDANTQRTVQKGSQASLAAQVPVGDILSGGATTPLAALVNLDLGGSVAHGAKHTQNDAAHTSGERIYAFCYRKVTFSFFALRNKVDTARLKADNCWAMSADNRGDDDDDDEEGVEVSLGEAEEVGEEGFEVPELDISVEDLEI
ncbi:hypothetical protein F5882DRAFT_418047 [Hyaloscypha sp. PMI_1271]|nr:hypothetical protein F5882DRAFT_418047 [Hyaloscypha sp. PMI_1271]